LEPATNGPVTKGCGADAISGYERGAASAREAQGVGEYKEYRHGTPSCRRHTSTDPPNHAVEKSPSPAHYKQKSGRVGKRDKVPVGLGRTPVSEMVPGMGASGQLRDLRVLCVSDQPNGSVIERSQEGHRCREPSSPVGFVVVSSCR